jgi:hypothetical protein
MVQAIIHARRGEMDQARTWYDRATHVKDDPAASHNGLEYARAMAEALITTKQPSG